MDKQLIERMKTAIEGECDGLAIDDKHAAAILDYVLDGYLARIDAERGKEARAWWNGEFAFAKFSLVENAVGIGKDGIPLFLSPTIPEGTALVPIEPTGEMLLVMQDAIHGGYDDERRLYAAIRCAAPQGEK